MIISFTFAECNCHEHADSCHFDATLFAASGNVTGGVCDNCQHFTEGINCQYCIQGYYQNKTDKSDPEVCQRKFLFTFTDFFCLYILNKIQRGKYFGSNFFL